MFDFTRIITFASGAGIERFLPDQDSQYPVISNPISELHMIPQPSDIQTCQYTTFEH